MAVREISYHDTFRLLRQHAAAQLLWAPESCAAEVATAGSLELSFAEKGASCSVYPDHLQPLEALDAAGLVGKNLDEAGVKAWLAEKQGKEITVGSTTGVPTHFVVVQDGAKPQVSGTPFEVSIRSVRDGEEVTVSDGSSAVLVPLEVEGGQLGQLFSGAHAELQQALLELCRSLHVTELRGTFIPAAAQAKYVVHQASMQLDETASYLCASKWGECRFPVPFGRPELPEESAVHELDSRTGASLKFSVLNRNGRVWTLIAGGGASVVYTDTICEYGFAKELANYGEYSGDPPEEFVYEYSKTVLSVMTASPEPQGKVLLIGGGVANFTDVASTFKGIVKALKEFGEKLRACGAKVWVRRGGPNYAEGLATMRKACEEIGVPAQVYGPEAHLTSIVRDALGQGKPLAPLPPPKVKMPSPGKDAAAAAGKLGNGFATLDVDMQAIVYGLQAKAVQRMLDFDTLCGRKTPSVLCVINPTGEASYEKFLFGSSDVLVPVYTSVKQAVQRHGEQAQMLISFASYRSAYDASLEALEFSDTIRTHAIIAEGVPEALTRRLHQAAAKKGVAIIGPATVGGIMPGRFRIGNAGGAVENLLLAKLYRAGSCSYTTKSGGMSNELNNIVALNTDGVREGIAIGGDRWPGVRFIDVLLRFEADPNVKMMALLGEVGGREEYSVAEAIADGRITKPVVAWCCGTAAEAFDYEVQFGHAGARARSSDEKAGSKNRALAEAGAHVPRSFDEFGDLIAQVYKALVDGGAIVPPASEPPVPTLPTDYEVLKKKGQVRKSTNFVCSISDDRGAEPTYGGVPVSEITADPDLGIGGVISLLWLRRRLPQYATKFLELCIIATADHGPCVSGAHNTIVAARAGKDLVSSLISGLATIGPRFGGALDDAAKMLSAAHDAGLSAADFVEKCKAEKKVIMGIGHRVKSINNPDARVVLIKDYAKKHFQSTALLDFGVAVEAVTTKKKANLILNVDGAMACCVVDMLRGCGFSKEETSELVDNGVLNGIFVAARTLGLIGHFLDQRRLKQPLYRHPYDDITYISS